MNQKLVHLGFPKWVHPEKFFVVSSENTDFLKKLFNMKIFSIKLVVKKVTLIFGVRWPLLLKNAHNPKNVFGPSCILMQWQYIVFCGKYWTLFLIYWLSTSTRWIYYAGLIILSILLNVYNELHTKFYQYILTVFVAIHICFVSGYMSKCLIGYFQL